MSEPIKWRGLKGNIVPLSGSPEGRWNMARWLGRALGYEEGALDDGPIPPISEMADSPLLRVAQLAAKRGPADFSYTPHPAEPRGVWTDPPGTTWAPR